MTVKLLHSVHTILLSQALLWDSNTLGTQVSNKKGSHKTELHTGQSAASSAPWNSKSHW
jgi:hypothetical protein